VLCLWSLEEAEENVELAVLSAMEHGQSPDIELAARVASVAILASAGIDAERSRLYLDLILISLSEQVRLCLEGRRNERFTSESVRPAPEAKRQLHHAKLMSSCPAVL
jgi:hypothetical protein